MPELDLGNVKGPQGKSAYQSALDAGYSGSEEAFNTAMAKAPDAVLYTAQSLSDAQKEQARGNINAAPGGFGLGGAAKVLTPDDDLNNVWEAGWYAWDTAPQNAPTYQDTPLAYCSLNVLNKGSAYNMHQIIYTFEGYEIHRSYDGGKQTWSEYAWVNPPMLLGVEYRTTERYWEKPVYAKLIPCGTIPANSTYTAYIDNADEAHAINAIVSAHIYSMSDNQYANEDIVYIKGGRALGGAGSQSYITLKNNYAGNSAGYYVLVKYTKATD